MLAQSGRGVEVSQVQEPAPNLFLGVHVQQHRSAIDEEPALSVHRPQHTVIRRRRACMRMVWPRHARDFAISLSDGAFIQTRHRVDSLVAQSIPSGSQSRRRSNHAQFNRRTLEQVPPSLNFAQFGELPLQVMLVDGVESGKVRNAVLVPGRLIDDTTQSSPDQTCATNRRAHARTLPHVCAHISGFRTTSQASTHRARASGVKTSAAD